MKNIIFTFMRYTAAAFLIAVCAVSLFGIIYYYGSAMALIPAAVAGVTFIASNALITKK